MFFFSKYQMKTRVRLQFVKRPDLKTHLMWLEKMAQHLFKAVRELLQSQQNIVTSHNRLCTLTRQQLAASADSFAGQFVEGPVRQSQTILLDEVVEFREESLQVLSSSP